ncbi:GNAT family N-acetyltransferase [Flavobacterium sp. Fl-77]|uniref:GNAT family N-acetyltransferase n=1 Tax=Flavobacterium flavipigmentatum TaxID=2893884 RepID=A0AAJ2S8V7_9FLAO|nr:MULTISPECIES: GNAT family N-acetyltransferase [unclassified Flavobacterium]MDX6183178.1 GNAT family N-acetyltransferase [Flavobacterium sp. Fl-33]MDX6186753.1 GNAT family N-acetyltransferase [Flavobacterium sp. Fl-77]UFH40407.1 GNAT family N-acetyltransferase [Flavobacterium sp. F-70]
MSTTYSFNIYNSAALLPVDWNLLASRNIFMTREYLEVLEKSAPVNMTCHFIGIFENENLIGIALAQFLFSEKLQSFGERDKCLKTSVRNFAFKNFASHVLFVGNNMLTGQNAFSIAETANKPQAVKVLHKAIHFLKKDFKSKGKKVHITSIKDFSAAEIDLLKDEFKNNYIFSTQPNMIFEINENWNTEQDYIEALSKKYRDQYKRARKKSDGVEKRKMSLEEIIEHENTIYDLYFHVAKNAPFNTFFLAKNHFRTFKEILKDKFLFYGYFIEEKLIGFNTLIKNGNDMDTYFLGYDESIQREKMLYLNMLYDMIAYSINQGFRTIVFARTALEIKSSVGAKPVKMYGLITHSNPFINKKMGKIFDYLEPKIEWQERNPFK